MIHKSKEITLQRDNHICQRCGKRVDTIAHRIAQTIANKKMIFRIIYETRRDILSMKKVSDIIHNHNNLVTSCNGICNDSWNIGNRKEIAKKLIDIIYSTPDKIISVEKLNKLLEL